MLQQPDNSKSSNDQDTRKSQRIHECFANFKNRAEYELIMVWENIKSKIRKF